MLLFLWLLIMKKKIVEVTWQDPAIDPGWIEKDDHHEELPDFKTYGILIRRSPHVVLAGAYDPSSKTYCDRSKFPKGCIKSIKVIAVVDL